MGVDGQRHTPATLHPGKSRYPLYRRRGGPQRRSGRVRKISPPPGFDLLTVQPVAVAIPTELSRPTRALQTKLKTSWLFRELKVWIFRIRVQSAIVQTFGLEHKRAWSDQTIRLLQTREINLIPLHEGLYDVDTTWPAVVVRFSPLVWRPGSLMEGAFRGKAWQMAEWEVWQSVEWEQ